MISGFNQMTAREMLLVEKLIKNAESVVVDLVLNHPYVDEPPKSGDLFYRAGNLYYQLYAHAHKSKSPVMLDTYAKKTRVSQDLCNLEDYWINSVAGFSAKEKATFENDSIKIYGARTRTEEIRFAAAKIRQMVAVEGYRYKDF